MTEHRPSAETWQVSDRQMNAFFAQSPDGIFYMALDEPVRREDVLNSEDALNYACLHQHVTHANNAILRQYRAPREQFIGRAFIDFYAHNPRHGKEMLLRLLDAGHLHLEMEQYQLDGTLIWIEGDYLCFYDAEGRITGHLGVQRDITERRQALREAEARYRALFDQSHDAVFILSLEGKHLAANRRAAEMLGYTFEEIQHLSFRELSAEPEASAGVLQRLLQGEHIPLYERLFRTKQGEVIPVEINVELVRDSQGTPLHIQSVARDIRERRRMEDALRQSEARQRALLAAMPDLMFRNRRDGTYLDYYTVSPDRLALPPEQFLGKTIREVMPAPFAELCMGHLEQALRTGEIAVFEYELEADGKRGFFEARMVASAPDEVLTIVRDITEHRQVQQQEFAFRLEKERVQILTQFIQSASHEFRTPLSIISTSAYMVSRSTSEAKQRYHAERIQEQIQRMTRLLDMLLVLSRLDSGLPFTKETIRLNTLIDQTSAGLRLLLTQKKLALHLHLMDDLPLIEGNAEYLHEMLRHLLDNAIRHTPPDGSITITTCVRDGWAGIEIQDTGTGIADHELPHIFQRFWRSDDAHTTPGFGLGLPIARQIVEQHGGKIEVKTTPGRGSIFTVLLPAAGDVSTLHSE